MSQPEFDQRDETVVGTHESGIILQEGLNVSLSRYYCSNCKRKTHCHVQVDKETKEAKIINTCTNSNCQCRCKTHYPCKNCGYIHPYGQDCPNIEPEKTSDQESNKEIDKILDDWRILNESKQQNMPKEKINV